MSESARTIDTLLDERRTFAPSAEFRARAKVTDQSLHDAAAADPEAFWAEQARKYVTWYRPFDKVLEWNLPFAKWFLGGELNVSYNCLDRHVEAGRGEKIAFHHLRARRRDTRRSPTGARRRLPAGQRAPQARSSAGTGSASTCR